MDSQLAHVLIRHLSISGSRDLIFILDVFVDFFLKI